MKSYKILDDELFEEIDNLSQSEKSDWLFLSPHPKFAGRWYVDSIDPHFFFDFEEIIGQYKSVSPATLSKFLDYAKVKGYKISFTEDPINILKAWESLNERPEFSLNSDMEGNVQGFLPFQLQGFNYLRRPEIKGGLSLWDTGLGKLHLIGALIKQHIEIEKAFDLVFVLVASNNKIDAQRKLKASAGIESIILDGPPKKKSKIIDQISKDLLEGPVIVVTNYEKFRDNYEEICNLIEDRRLLLFYDEMPTKLRNRSTQIYQAFCSILYKEAPRVNWEDLRPAALRSYQMTATPIENSPIDQLNCIRLMAPDVFPTISGWEREFVASRNFFSKLPESFKDLDKMGLMTEFMTHQVSKEDPDIAKYFPEVNPIDIIIDWHPADRKIYEKLQNIAIDLAEEAKEDIDVKSLNAFQLIGILQMLCDAPSMVQKSAKNRKEFELAVEEDEEITAYGSEAALILVNSLDAPLSDENHTKLAELKRVIEKHPNEKIIIFSALAGYIQPVLEAKFREWDVTYVTYRGTDKQRQEAKDLFRNNPAIQILLSSDAGSTSIDLPEASVVINYDLPMKWSTLVQRVNRAHRVNSKHKSVTFYRLMMANSIEDRIAQIIETKHGYHRQMYKGELKDEAISSRMSAEDIFYILSGLRN